MSANVLQDPLATDLLMGKAELHFTNPHTIWNRLGRVLWHITWLLFFRFTPRFMLRWRATLLRCFGAKIGPRCAIYPSCRIWAPWNLQMGEESCLGEQVDCYSVNKIRIGAYATVSQYSYLCTASHDINSPDMRLVTAPIVIEAKAWVCAGAFVGPGVTLGEGSVAAARAVVVKNVEPWAVVGGNPAKFIKVRKLKDQ